MTKSINKVTLLGNLGDDPKIRYTPAGAAVANISLATSKRLKDKSTGELLQRTQWHKIVIFNRQAEIAAQYLKKGSKVYIEGSLRTFKWQDNDGEDRILTEIVCSDFIILDGKAHQTIVGDNSSCVSPSAAKNPLPSIPNGLHFDNKIPF